MNTTSKLELIHLQLYIDPRPFVMSKSKPGTRGTDFKVMKQETPVWESFLGFQQVENHEVSTVDTHLICSDGVVPAHAFVLQAVSPFFDKMFRAQGEFYFGIRPVLLCDYKAEEIQRMIQFIYSGFIRVKSEKEATTFKNFLSTFQVNLENSTLENPSRTGVHHKARTELAALSFSGPAAEQLKKIHVQPFVPPVNDVKTGSSNGKSISTLPKKPTIPNSKRKPDSDNEHISSTDISDEEIDDSLFTDTEWFLNEAKRCQKCKKQCKTAAAASMCLTSHNRLRCYFCFKVVRNTEKLFTHFSKRHKKAGRENCLLCPFCEQTVPFKSVSCHVISLHLADPKAREQLNSNNKNQLNRGRSAIVEPAAKKAKQDDGSQQTKDSGTVNNNTHSKNDSDDDKREYKLQNLEIILRNRSITGKIRVITVKKDRSCAPVCT